MLKPQQLLQQQKKQYHLLEEPLIRGSVIRVEMKLGLQIMNVLVRMKVLILVPTQMTTMAITRQMQVKAAIAHHNQTKIL